MSSNKSAKKELERIFGFNFLAQASYKFNAKWNNGLKMLIVDVKEEKE